MPSPTDSKPSRNVFNLSGFPLNPGEIQLLDKGLSFCPPTFYYDYTQLDTSIQASLRRIKLYDHFNNIPDDPDYSLDDLQTTQPSSEALYMLLTDCLHPSGLNERNEMYSILDKSIIRFYKHFLHHPLATPIISH